MPGGWTGTEKVLARGERLEELEEKSESVCNFPNFLMDEHIPVYHLEAPWTAHTSLSLPICPI